jgi:hypothetical protein
VYALLPLLIQYDVCMHSSLYSYNTTYVCIPPLLIQYDVSMRSSLHSYSTTYRCSTLFLEREIYHLILLTSRKKASTGFAYHINNRNNLGRHRLRSHRGCRTELSCYGWPLWTFNEPLVEAKVPHSVKQLSDPFPHAALPCLALTKIGGLMFHHAAMQHGQY